jgi:hypothetical protein
MTTNKFITISTDPTAWGDTEASPDFSVADEANRIRVAAESAGIVVRGDNDPREFYAADGGDMEPIDWWSTWCHVGHEWSNEQWREFFADC